MKIFNWKISRIPDFVAIDLYASTLKLLHLKIYPDRREIQNLKVQNITSLNDEEIFKIIDSFLTETGAKNPYIVGVLPAYLVITKNIEIPSVDPKEIKEIVNLQAARHTPYSHEEIAVDFINLGSFKRNYTQIILLIVPQQIIKRSFNLVEKTGFRLEKVCFSVEGLAYSVERLFNINTQNVPVNLLHIDEISTDFLVVFKNKPFFIRSIPVGTNALTGQEKDKSKQRFIQEIKRSLELYQSENLIGMPQQFILTGAIQDLNFLAKDLTEELGFPFKSMGYFKNITFSKNVESSFLLNKNVSLMSLIAPSLDKEAVRIEFIPEEIKIRRDIEQKTKDFLKTTVYVLAILILIFLNLMIKIHLKSSYLKLLNKKYLALAKEAEELEKNFSRLLLIKNYLSKQNLSLDILMELYKVIPEDVEFTEVRFDIESKFVLRGRSQSMSGVFNLVDNLNKSSYFKEVKTKYTTRRKEQDREVVEFEINANLKI